MAARSGLRALPYSAPLGRLERGHPGRSARKVG